MTENDRFLTYEKLSLYKRMDNLFDESVPSATVIPYYNASGDLTTLLHVINGETKRTDSFSYSDSSVTEVREMSTGETLTIVTNLTTGDISQTLSV